MILSGIKIINFVGNFLWESFDDIGIFAIFGSNFRHCLSLALTVNLFARIFISGPAAAAKSRRLAPVSRNTKFACHIRTSFGIVCNNLRFWSRFFHLKTFKGVICLHISENFSTLPPNVARYKRKTSYRLFPRKLPVFLLNCIW